MGDIQRHLFFVKRQIFELDYYEPLTSDDLEAYNDLTDLISSHLCDKWTGNSN